MVKVHNKQKTDDFQDDFDALFNAVDAESYADAFEIDDHFESMAQTNVDSEILNDNHALMVTDMERPDLKLVKSDSKLDRKQDIDALLDSIAGDDDFSFDDFKRSPEVSSLKADMLSIVANKNRESVSLNDFDAFDEFGEIDDFGTVSANPNDFKTEHKLEKPSSLVDLEETLGSKYKPALSKVDSDFVSLDSDDDYFFKTISNTDIKTETESKSKITAESKSIVAKVSEKQSSMEGYALLDDDLDEMPSASVATKAVEDTTLGLFNTTEEDDFVPMGDVINPPEADFLSDVSVVQNSGFSEIDDFDMSVMDTSTTPDYQSVIEEDTHFQPVISTQNSGFSEIDDFDTPIATVAERSVAAAIAEVPALKASPVVETKATVDLEAKIEMLMTSHHEIQQQIAVLATQKTEGEPLDKMELLDQQSKDRRERKQLQDLLASNQKKSSKLLYGVAGVSLLSLVIGGGLLAYGLGPLSDMRALSAKSLVVDQEIAALKAGGTAGAEGESVAQLSEQVKNIRALLTGDKTVLAHGLHAGVSKGDSKAVVSQATETHEPPADQALSDIQSKVDKSIRVIATVNKAGTTSAKKTSGQWVANLLSVRQDGYAKQKATEFAKQGIATVVVPINIKGQTVYILRSNGFATQDQAIAYATQAKKTLNLSSILVTPDE